MKWFGLLWFGIGLIGIHQLVLVSFFCVGLGIVGFDIFFGIGAVSLNGLYLYNCHLLYEYLDKTGLLLFFCSKMVFLPLPPELSEMRATSGANLGRPLF